MTFTAFGAILIPSAWVKYYSFVLSAPYILQSLMEMLLTCLDGTRFLLVACQIRVDELD